MEPGVLHPFQSFHLDVQKDHVEAAALQQGGATEKAADAAGVNLIFQCRKLVVKCFLTGLSKKI